ncbi:MAG: superinfection immunity protein [Acetobacter aceti]|uniref:Iduronate sulfatase n=1 Tax=Acetobacter aceti TaxID=435 RepID=A0A1U9KE13_ACEAC|nr:iduronate sulfatase [Acetobacter aceti]
MKRLITKSFLAAISVLSTGIVTAQAGESSPPLVHAEMGEHEHIALASAGLNASVDLVEKPDCAVATLLGGNDTLVSGACRMAVLTLKDSLHPDRPAFTTLLTPYSRDGSDVRDLQLDLRHLDVASPLPQAVVSVYTGGAHCCALTSIVGMTKNGTWTATQPPELSGEGRPLFTDIDKDGAQEIVSSDGSFLYTFASHAGSYTPSVIYRYTDGRLVDITTDSVSRPYLERTLKESEGFWVQQDRNEPNGFLAYYVAMKANMGEFPAGWSYMLPRYDHEIDAGFSLSRCTLGGRLEAECTPEERKPLPFPQALAGFLVAGHYVTSEQALAAAPEAEAAIQSANGYRPDFSCSTPPQKNGVATMLCENSDAAQHELQFDQVYYALRQLVGPGGWRALKQEIILAENAVDQQCGLPVPGAADQTLPSNATGCYAAGMDTLSEQYRKKLSGPALEESKRPIAQHIALQRRLIKLGYLPAASTADGVYGESTRAAIVAWQRDTGRPDVSSFLSDADAAVLLGTPPVVAETKSPAEAISQKTDTAQQETTISSLPQPSKNTIRLFGLSGITALIAAAAGIALYFVPFVIACVRDTVRKPAVFAVNLFFGWTGLGWIAALVMACRFVRLNKGPSSETGH